MLLKSLEIKGFKSFPDKTVLTFGDGITAVVGPNGSGKSNISDAIRWVLGEQSNKALRGSKMEDVVFNGTSSRKSLGYAEVSLTINNEKRFLDFDADEVCVTRRYYRSGESEYMLNNATVRLKDIQLLFMDTGLGRDGYSIIGQGRIEDIVSSRSDDRREIFEEAAGIAKYRYKKNEAERRLQNAEDNLLRLRDILQELEDRIGPLETQSNKAKKFLAYADEKKGLEIGLWLHTLDTSRDVLRELGGKLELARTQYDNAAAAIADVEAKIEEIGNKAADLTVQMDELTRAAAAFEEDAVRHEGEIAVRRNDIDHHNENIARMQAEQAQQSVSVEQLDEERATRLADIDSKKEQIAAAEKERLALSEKMDALSRDSDEAGNKMEEENRHAADLAKQIADVRVREVTGESSLAEINTRLSQLNAAVLLKKDQSEAAAAEKKECSLAVATCKEKIDSLQNAVTGYSLRHKSRSDKAEAARVIAEKLRLDVEDHRRRLRILEELERSMEGFSGSTKAVMKQAGRGALRGILGPVAGLLEAKADVALAIETALGNNAQNVVCETESDAKSAIRFLKNENAGRVTFLPLETIRGGTLDEKELKGQTGYVGIASDLISYDKKYTDVMESLLGRTAVAEDLDCATALAKKTGYRIKFVTLDGQLVHAGGSLTGGSHVKGAGLLSRRTEMDKLSTALKEMEEKSQKANADYISAKEDAAAAEAALSGAQGELTTAQEDGIRLEAELRRVTELAENGDQAVADCVNEIETLNARIVEIRADMEAAGKESAALIKEQTAIETKLTELSGGRAEMTAAREELSAQMAELKLQEHGFEKEIEALQAVIEGIDRRKTDSDGATKLLQGQIELLKLQIEAVEKEILDLQAQADECRKNAAASREQMENLIKERTNGEQSVTALRQASKEQMEEKERLSGEVARLEEKAFRAEAETDEIVRKLYEEYELTRAEAEAQTEPIENVPEAQKRLTELRSKIRALGTVNVDAIEEFKEVSERYAFLSEQVKDVEISRKELLDLINDLTTQMREMFVDRFNQINKHFGIVFAELFGGGKAELKLEEPDDVLHSGIQMNIQPPGKVILNLDALSGGEKALTAIALLFAILKVTPSPFCVLDEIEAALDDVNVSRYAQFLRRMTDETQFIVITHRRGTMEEADVLYGVTMQESGVTKLLELRASEVEERLGMKLGERSELA